MPDLPCVDPPATVAVLGAGPVGLEAALYARYLGYDVHIYERGGIAQNVLDWGHTQMFSPFEWNCSSLGLAALGAQDPNCVAPSKDAILTGKQWAEQYLIPLARSDLLVDRLHEHTTVVSVGRDGMLKQEEIGSDARQNVPFLLLLRDAEGREQTARAQVVIDSTGTYGFHRWLGHGGIPAKGEMSLIDRIEFGLPDVLGGQSHRYAGRHTLLVGGGYSAATSAVALAELARNEPDTCVTWITRSSGQPDVAGPIRRISMDRLPERDRLAVKANELATGVGTCVTHWSETTVDWLAWDEATRRLNVGLIGRQNGQFSFDGILANVGYRPDNRLYEELQVHECYATGGPMKVAANLIGQQSADCLDQTSGGVETLLNPEPYFFVLGSKSYGRNSQFLVTTGHEQIRELFAMIAGRADLNLYETV